MGYYDCSPKDDVDNYDVLPPYEEEEEFLMEPENSGFGDELNYFDENPKEDPFVDALDPSSLSLEYKDEVVEKVLNAVEAYLEFATFKDLIILLTEEF